MNLNNIEFHCIDAELLDYPTASFDAVTIRWGLMFMPQPQDCLTAAHKTLKQNGRISLACWAASEKNPFISVLLKVLSHYMELPVPPPGTPGIFSFADPERLHDVLASTGYDNIKLEEMEIDVIEVEDGRAYWEAISDLAAPVMVLVDQLEQTARLDYINEVISVADTLKQGDTLCMKGTTWIASATK
jgi:SAM-dependent methyltransferase